jgi:[ribosomal protein S18]-alanine N-acetyltransferase
MSDALVIRLAEPRDVPDIMKIEKAQFAEPWTMPMMMSEITMTDTRRYTVAMEGERLVGYLGLMYVLDDEMHINTIGVLPGLERRGIASALLDDGWADAKWRGVKRVTLEVAASNVGAQALYRKYHFAPVGVRRNYYERTGEDAIVMWADLQ